MLDCSVSSTDLALLGIDWQRCTHTSELLKKLYWLIQKNDKPSPGEQLKGDVINKGMLSKQRLRHVNAELLFLPTKTRGLTMCLLI